MKLSDLPSITFLDILPIRKGIRICNYCLIYRCIYTVTINPKLIKVVNKILVAFQKNLEFAQYEITNSNSVLRRLASCFPKAFVSKITDAVKTKDTKAIKRLRLTTKR